MGRTRAGRMSSLSTMLPLDAIGSRHHSRARNDAQSWAQPRFDRLQQRQRTDLYTKPFRRIYDVCMQDRFLFVLNVVELQEMISCAILALHVIMVRLQ
eukprot:m.1319873 g.1319873  ORF g.1319873 m.1319873 type:complete len:98 (-) comp24845_c0_seq28:3701-3994(-)